MVTHSEMGIPEANRGPYELRRLAAIGRMRAHVRSRALTLNPARVVTPNRGGSELRPTTTLRSCRTRDVGPVSCLPTFVPVPDLDYRDPTLNDSIRAAGSRFRPLRRERRPYRNAVVGADR